MDKKLERQTVAPLDASEQSEESRVQAYAGSQASLVGTTLNGRYELQSVLGLGGWSAVYKGLDLNLKRPVAVKILHAHLSVNLESVQRFRQEALAVSQIAHPNLAAVYDFGVADKQQLFIVMEPVEGQTLEQILAKTRIDWRSAVTFALQLCDALETVHAHYLVHRDVKPSNIMIVTDRLGQKQAKLLDFGLVKCPSDLAGHHTGSGQTVGTPAYMSPEQCMGSKLDGRADIYSLGCCLYEMLTGRQLFDHQSPLAYMHMHLAEAPPPMENVGVQNIPEEVKAAVLKSLAKKPEQRFCSPSEMAQELRLALAKYSATAHAAKTNRTSVLLGAAAGIGFIAVAAVCLVSSMHHPLSADQSSIPGPVPADLISGLTRVPSPPIANRSNAQLDSPKRQPSSTADSLNGKPMAISLHGFYPTDGPYLLDRLRISVKLNELKQHGGDAQALETMWMRMDADANRRQEQAVLWDVQYMNKQLGLPDLTQDQRSQLTLIETQR